MFYSKSIWLVHTGVAHDENPPGRGSGRYPWGSGKQPYHHESLSYRRRRLNGKTYRTSNYTKSANTKSASSKKNNSIADYSKHTSNNSSNKKKLSSKTNSDAKAIKNNNSVDTEKILKVLKYGGIAVAAGLAAYGGYKLYGLYKNSNNSIIDPNTGLPLLQKEESVIDCVNNINPGRVRDFVPSSSAKNIELINGSSQNCMLCTTAYELRQRGYDVRAGFSVTGYTPDSLFPTIFKEGQDVFSDEHFSVINTSFTYTVSSNADLIKNDITKLCNGKIGARGNIMVYWKTGRGGHSMIWQMMDDGIHYFDGQTGVEYKDFSNKILSHVNFSDGVAVLRTDNLEFDFDALKKYNVINTKSAYDTYVDNGKEVVMNAITNTKEGQVAVASLYVSGIASVKQHQLKKESTK